MQKLADRADLSGEGIPGVPVVELAGDGRVLVEGHDGVSQYSRERIGVKVKFGQVCILGNDLELTMMTREQLVISGRIRELKLQGRETP